MSVCVRFLEGETLRFPGPASAQEPQKVERSEAGALQVSVLSGEGQTEVTPPPQAPQCYPLPFSHLPGLPASSASKRQAGLYLPRLGEKWPGLKGEVAFQALN